MPEPTYSVWIDPSALREAHGLPGHVRQRIRRAIDQLGDRPRPPHSRVLEAATSPVEIRRVRIDRWRVVYAVSDAERWVWVLGVRKRPPYAHEDLPSVLERLRELRG